MLAALAYVTTVLFKKSKFVGKGRNINVVERFYLASDKMLLIVKVGEDFYFMSSDKTGMKLIDKLDEFTPNEKEILEPKFSEILQKIKMNKDK
jgi:ABC-type cobalt transport system substrate-binding protein